MDSYSVDRERWNTLSLVERLGNVSSEVRRAIGALRAGKARRAAGAFERYFNWFALAARAETDRAQAASTPV